MGGTFLISPFEGEKKFLKNLEQSKLRIRTQDEVEKGRLGKDVELEIRKWFNIAEIPKERKILLDNLLKKYDKKQHWKNI